MMKAIWISIICIAAIIVIAQFFRKDKMEI